MRLYSARMRTISEHARHAAVEAVDELARAGLGAQAFLEAVHERIERTVPSDGVFYAAADPDSGLAMGAGISTLPHEICAPFWEHEFFVPDYTKYAELARGPRYASDLHQATGGRPQRSARWRAFKDLLGCDAELRASFTVDGSTWGVAQLSRLTGVAPFSDDEVALLDTLAPVVARGLRAALTTQGATVVAERGPGMAIIDRDGRLVSLTGEAEAWLADLANAALGRDGRRDVLPFELAALSSLARARHAEGGPVPRMRMRTGAGVWLLAHASLLSGGADHVALVIEPAKASEVAPLVVEAYGLTPRELEVTRMIARGMRTGEIADRLVLSPHTIRDHVKAIFEKVGVSSRGELVATIFADHYHPGLDDAIWASEARLGTGR